MKNIISLELSRILTTLVAGTVIFYTSELSFAYAIYFSSFLLWLWRDGNHYNLFCETISDDKVKKSPKVTAIRFTLWGAYLGLVYYLTI